MSDKVKDGFKPINLSALEIFDGEQASRNKDSEPDWDKFKAFYEDLKSEQKESDIYKDLFVREKESVEKEKPSFEQFGQEKTKGNNIRPEETVDNASQKAGSEPGSGSTDDLNPQGVENETGTSEPGSEDLNTTEDNDKTVLGSAAPKEAVHDQEGYDKGYEKGSEDGQKDGYEKGFEQGEKEGQEQGSKEGYEKGYEKGESEAGKKVEIEITERAEDFKEILSKLENTYQELAARYEDKMISLVCSIAEKVVLAKVEIDEEIVKETVLDALKTLPEPEDITLSVSDEDYEYIEMVKEDLFDFVKSLKSVTVKSDASVKRGGCRIETKQGYVETDIETKLEKIFLAIQGK